LVARRFFSAAANEGAGGAEQAAEHIGLPRLRRGAGGRRYRDVLVGDDDDQLAGTEAKLAGTAAVVHPADIEADVAHSRRHRQLAHERGDVDRLGECRAVSAVRAQLRHARSGGGVGDVGPAVGGVREHFEYDRLAACALDRVAAELVGRRADARRHRLG
jgi:hypothetical protein